MSQPGKRKGLEAGDADDDFQTFLKDSKETEIKDEATPVEEVLETSNNESGFITGALPDAPIVADTIVAEEVATAVETLVSDMVAKSEALSAAVIEEVAIPEPVVNKINLGGEKMNNFYVPKKTAGAKGLTKEIIKKIDTNKIEEALKLELTGKGSSKISGLIDLHVEAETIQQAIIKLITSVGNQVDVPNKEIFSNFIKGIVGTSAQLSYDMNRAPLTVANFYKEATAKIMAENPNMNAQAAGAEAAELVTGYIGKSVLELKSSAAGMPVKLLTLVVKRNAIPTNQGKDDKLGINLICNPFTSEYVKSVIADEEFVYIGINLAKLFRYSQSHFSNEDIEDTKFISATIISNSANMHTVVYRVEKK